MQLHSGVEQFQNFIGFLIYIYRKEKFHALGASIGHSPQGVQSLPQSVNACLLLAFEPDELSLLWAFSDQLISRRSALQYFSPKSVTGAGHVIIMDTKNYR
jgi:hypothetical protein